MIHRADRADREGTPWCTFLRAPRPVGPIFGDKCPHNSSKKESTSPQRNPGIIPEGPCVLRVCCRRRKTSPHEKGNRIGPVIGRRRKTFPHGGVRPLHQKSTCLTQSTLGPDVLQIWSRYGQNLDRTKPLYSTVRTTGLSTRRTTQRTSKGFLAGHPRCRGCLTRTT